MAGTNILGRYYLTADHSVLIRLHDLAGDTLADDLLGAFVHQGGR